MQPILTCCGYHRDLCLAYKPNSDRTPANRQKLCDGWFKYYGFRLPAAEICCDGCMSENPKLIDTTCPVRPWVIEKGLDNRAQCEQYVCEKFMQRLVTLEQVKERIGAEIPEDDYVCFIKSYENKRRLDVLQKTRRHRPS